MKVSEAEIALDLDFNVAEPPVGAEGAWVSTESIRGAYETVVRCTL